LIGALVATLALLTAGTPSSAHSQGFLAFAFAPRHPAGIPDANVLERGGTAGRSRQGRPIRLIQLGDPALPGRLLVFGCIHGDECAARALRPLRNGCPDPRSSVFFVPDLNPDGFARDSRLNAGGVDLNRNFGSRWRAGGRRGEPQYPGPRPFSEPETRLATRIVRRLGPERARRSRLRPPSRHPFPPPSLAGGDGAELAEPPLPRGFVVRRRATSWGPAPGATGPAGRGPGSPRPESEPRLRCPEEGVTVGS
jgi:hypothetical protein